jgi:hypothetical protein
MSFEFLVGVYFKLKELAQSVSPSLPTAESQPQGFDQITFNLQLCKDNLM